MSRYELIHRQLTDDEAEPRPKTRTGRAWQRILRFDLNGVTANAGWVLYRDGNQISVTQEPWTFDEARNWYLRVMGLRLDWAEAGPNRYTANR